MITAVIKVDMPIIEYSEIQLSYDDLFNFDSRGGLHTWRTFKDGIIGTAIVKHPQMSIVGITS